MFQVRFPSTKRAATLARHSLMKRIASLGYASAELSEIECAVGEALANAAEHGHLPGSAFDLRAYVDDEHVVFEVQDQGGGFLGSLDAVGHLPPSDSPRGFGIYIMRQFMDAIEYEERGTRVRLKKRLPVAKKTEGKDTAAG
jgi:anti-sigma regulatory factor (Ser/Thr protein kinase)